MLRCAMLAALLMVMPSIAPAQMLDVPAQPAGGGAVADAVVQPGDILRVSVWPDDKYGGEFPVEESGIVHLPLLGPVNVASMSIDDLRSRLRDGYRLSMKDAVVTVTPLFRVSVVGAVARPGLYSVDPTHTLFDVISLAGGFREAPEVSRVRVIRGGQTIEIGSDAALGADPSQQEMELVSGDRIVVVARQSRGADLFRLATTVLNLAVLGATLAFRLSQ